MKKITLSILALVLAQGAIAQQCTTLLYTGAPFDKVTTAFTCIPGTDCSNTEFPTITSPLTGYITLATPLTPNMVNAPAAVNGYSLYGVTYGPGPGNPAVSWPPGTFFDFTTDANGNITDWSMSSIFDAESTDNVITSSPQGDLVSFSGAGVAGPPPPVSSATIAGSSSSPGTWTCQETFNASYTAPAVPPAVNPLAAQVAALTAQVASLTASNAALVAELHKLQDYYVATINGDNAEIAALTAEVEKLK